MQPINKFFQGLIIFILTPIVAIFLSTMTKYIWQNATRIEDVFPLMGDFVIICLWELLKWVSIIVCACIAVGSLAWIVGVAVLSTVRIVVDILSNRTPPIESIQMVEGGGERGMDSPNSYELQRIGERELSKFLALGIKSFHPNDSGLVTRIFKEISVELQGKQPDQANELGSILVSKGLYKLENGKYVFVDKVKPVEIQSTPNETSAEYYDRTGNKIGKVNNRGLASEMIKDFPEAERKKYLVGVNGTGQDANTSRTLVGQE